LDIGRVKAWYEAWKPDISQPQPSHQWLQPQLNAIKREQFPWTLEVTKNAPKMAIILLGQATPGQIATRFPDALSPAVRPLRVTVRSAGTCVFRSRQAVAPDRLKRRTADVQHY
jgi:hypothetical protein